MSQTPAPTDHDRAANAAAAQAVVRHHAQLAAGLDQRVEALLHLVGNDYLLKAEGARQDLLAYVRREILPHAQAEETALYPPAAAHIAGHLLVAGMIEEHQALTALVSEIAAATAPVRAAAAGRALSALFAAHLAKENDLVLPLLIADPTVSLAGVLAGMHDLLGDDRHGSHPHTAESAAAGPEARTDGCGGHCGCNGDQTADSATALTIDNHLDVRDVPHDQRHALVLSTVAALEPGTAVVLVAAHAPRPVLAEVEARFHDQIHTQWLQSGPEVWQVRLERVTAAA